MSLSATAHKTHRQRPWLLVGISLATFLALAAATFLLPQDSYVRYQQLDGTLQFRTVWDYERIVFDKTPIDVAVLGNSRIEAAVSAPDLGRTLSEKLSRPIHVANLAQPQEGRNAHYVMFKNLIEHHPELKLAIVSVIEQMPREGHPTFRYIADPADTVRAPLFINTKYFEDLSFQPYRQISIFSQQLFPRIFKVHRAFDPGAYAGTDLDTTKSYLGADGKYVDHDQVHTADELMGRARGRISNITRPILPQWGENAEFVMDRSYTRSIANLARSHGVRVVFLFLPIFQSHLYVHELDFYEKFGPVIDARFLADDPRNYSDYGHLDRIGSGRLTHWLGNYIIEHHFIAPPPQPSQAPIALIPSKGNPRLHVLQL